MMHEHHPIPFHQMQKKSVAIVGTTGLPAKYGGFETLAHHLVDRLNATYDITVYCSSKYFADKSKRPATFKGAKLVYFPLNANGYQSIIYDIFSIIHALRKSDVILLLGVSGAIILPFIRFFSKKPILVNIDGQEWKRPKWNRFARAFLHFSERLAVKYADTVITDNLNIRHYVEDVYKRHDAWLIEYGADHVSPVAMSDSIQTKYPFSKSPYAFKVCRIEPENNVHVILQAFAEMPEQVLVIVGLWNHGSYGMNLKEKYSVYENIHLLDPIYDQHELNSLRSNAYVYVHGHSAGGTNPSLVEAMMLGLPVVSYDVSYNKETTGYRATYFSHKDDLIKIFRSLDHRKIAMMGTTMKAIATMRYTWQRITSLYSSAILGHKFPVASMLTSKTAKITPEIIELTFSENVHQKTA